MLSRAALTAGKKPPTNPITSAKISALTTTPTDNANPKPSSENDEKFMVDTCTTESPDAHRTPTPPPTSPSSIHPTRHALNTAHPENPRDRSAATPAMRDRVPRLIV